MPCPQDRTPAVDARWKHDGMKVIPVTGSLEPTPAQTQGMNRKTAIDFARAGASKLWGGTATF